MLRLANSYQGTDKKWLVECKELLEKGLRSPQGFTFEFGNDKIGNHFWTTNEFAAYLFYKRYNWATNTVAAEFDYKKGHENYLYKLSYATNSEIVLKEPEGLSYRPHQKAGIEFCLLAKNVLVADEQRTGKTPTALGVINNLPNLNKILIICPKTAKFGWNEECGRWLIKDYKMQMVSSQTPVDKTANIYIINYDNLHIQTDLMKMTFDLVIGDEIHLVKNLDTRRAKFFFAINADKKIGMSGTPLLNQPQDLLTVLQWLDPFWKDFSIFRGKFANQAGISISLEEVKDLARSSLLLRRLQAQGIFDAEPIEKRLVTLPVTEEAKPLVEAELRDLTQYAKVRRELGLTKVQYALNHIETYSTEGEKLVVFAWHKDVIKRIGTSLGNKAVTIFGESTDKERKEAVHRFQNDPKCTTFLGSIAAASMALNLSVASHIVFVECEWSKGLMEQAEERCSDKLQKRQVFIEYLVYENSLDYKILSKNALKEMNSDKALDIIY